jgi:hypothetical protein
MDMLFLEMMAHLVRERIPERVVHAKGAGGDWLCDNTIIRIYFVECTNQLHKPKLSLCEHIYFYLFIYLFMIKVKTCQ